MKYILVTLLLSLIVLLAACAPADGQDNSSYLLGYGCIGIIIIFGWIILVLTLGRRQLPKTTRVDNSGQNKSVPNQLIVTPDVSETKSKDGTEINNNDLDIHRVEAVKMDFQGAFPADKSTTGGSNPKSTLPIQLNNGIGDITNTVDEIQGAQIIHVIFEPKEIKSQAGSEIVNVPKGVVVKVKRTRSVEHTLRIEWVTSFVGKGEIGIKQLVSVSIQEEIQRLKGNISQKTETTE